MKYTTLEICASSRRKSSDFESYKKSVLIMPIKMGESGVEFVNKVRA